MGYQTWLARVVDIDPVFAAAWDAMPPARGAEADFHDSHAAFAAWCAVAGPRVTSTVRIPAVLDGRRPVGLLPLEIRGRGHWESAGARAFRTHRKRYRPVLGSEGPDEEVVGLLVEQVARAGVREVSLNRLPSRDPATGALVAALRQSGYRVHAWERSSDCLAVVEGGWEEYRRRFAGFERSVKRLRKRCDPWPLELEEYGPRAGTSVIDGFALYEELHGRSWKGSLAAGPRRERLALLQRAEELGWSRIYVLRVAGLPAAAEIWLRLGKVASVPSVVYDQRLAALGPGSIIAWRALERILADDPPRVVDLLPGHNLQKDRMASDRPPLLVVEAARRPVVPGASLPLRRRTRRLRQAAITRMVALGRRARPRLRARPAGGTRPLRVEPGLATLPAARLELDAPLRRFLAVSGGHRSPEAMAATWAPGDTWWRVGEEPAALFRLGDREPESTPVREVVLVGGGTEQVEELLRALAAVVEAPLSTSLPAAGRPGGRNRPIPVHRALLPWPAGPATATKVP